MENLVVPPLGANNTSEGEVKPVDPVPAPVEEVAVSVPAVTEKEDVIIDVTEQDVVEENDADEVDYDECPDCCEDKEYCSCSEDLDDDCEEEKVKPVDVVNPKPNLVPAPEKEEENPKKKILLPEDEPKVEEKVEEPKKKSILVELLTGSKKVAEGLAVGLLAKGSDVTKNLKKYIETIPEESKYNCHLMNACNIAQVDLFPGKGRIIFRVSGEPVIFITSKNQEDAMLEARWFLTSTYGDPVIKEKERFIEQWGFYCRPEDIPEEYKIKNLDKLGVMA